jgi:hypothetical protein
MEKTYRVLRGVGRMIEHIHDHMAFVCECGSVHFCLLRTGKIECAGCGVVIGKRWVEFQ